MNTSIILAQEALPGDPDWLGEQTCPVIAYGPDAAPVNADVTVADEDAARALAQRVEAFPLAAMVLVQVLRSTEKLPVAQALDMESLAYSTLQTGPEFKHWQQRYQSPPLAEADGGAPMRITRTDDVIEAVLNRPGTRNALSVEMRDALVEVLTVMATDTSVRELHFRGNGACFSSGGELREFGSSPDSTTAHWIRTVHSPARLLAKLGDRITCYVHGACIGSGLELPAFARHVAAHRKTFFQLPELALGLIPGAGGTVSIARRIGRHRTAWMVLSGRRVNAQTALEWRLVDELMDELVE